MRRAIAGIALAVLLACGLRAAADPVPYVSGPQPAADITGTINQVIGNINGRFSALSAQAGSAGGGVSRGYIQSQLTAQASNTLYSAGAVSYAAGVYTALPGAQPAPTTLAAGQVYFVNFSQANLSAANLVIAGLAPKPLKVVSAAGSVLTLTGGEIVAGPATVYYDGTEFIYSGPTALSTPVTGVLSATQADFAGRTTFYLTSGSETLTLPCSATLSPNGAVSIFSTSGTATLAVGGACGDTITKNGSSGTSTTIAAGAAVAIVVTDGAGHFYVSGS